MLKFLRRSLWGLVYLLPAVLFFSYHPVISLGSNSSMNFELSLPLIWLVLFNLLAFISVIYIGLRTRKSPETPETAKSTKTTKSQEAPTSISSRSKWGINFLGISDRRFFIFSLLPFYATISVFWSSNPLRGLLTAGIIWLIFFAVFSILYILPVFDSLMLDKSGELCYYGDNPSSRAVSALPKNQTSLNPTKTTPIDTSPTLKDRPRREAIFLTVFFITTFIVCVFCLAQSIFDTLGASRADTLLCAGCTYSAFGFPHPSGFAIEPQFMGNLLLAPTLTVLYLIIFRAPRPSRRSFGSRFAPYALAVFFSTTLFFTFSRGAIYAYAVALFIMFIISLIRRRFRLSLIGIPVFSFILALGLQGTFAMLGPTGETFDSAVAKSIHQLSLGIIDFRQPVNQVNPNCPPDADKETNPFKQHEYMRLCGWNIGATATPTFDGYVAESTNTRLSLNAVALRTWSSRASSLVFGTGLGGAGTAMHDYSLSHASELQADGLSSAVTSPKEIVQNEPISLLLELGLIGVLIIIFELILAFAGKSFWKASALPLLLPLLVAYIITLNFFSGLPNALHIYLLPPLLYLLLI